MSEHDILCPVCRQTMVPVDDLIVVCSVCNHASSTIPPDPSIYDKSYAVKYRRYEKTEDGLELQKIRLDTVQQVLREGDTLKSILDFGCGSGHFVKYCQEQGVDCAGFDINPYSGYCDLTSLFYQRQVITFWDVLEHVRDPIVLLLGLRPEYVVVSTPNMDAFPGEKSSLRKWHHCYPEEHVQYFSEQSLKQLLVTAGYRVVLTNYNESAIRSTGGPKNILTVAGRIPAQAA